MADEVWTDAGREKVFLELLVHRFLMPFLFVGRAPTQEEVASEMQRLQAAGVPFENLGYFGVACQSIVDDCIRLQPTKGSA